MKDKIIELLMNELCYAYCDNCKGGELDEPDNYCDDCHRKSQNWALAEHTAKELANTIENQYKEIIEYLIEWLEDEHMGMDNTVRENLEEKFDFYT